MALERHDYSDGRTITCRRVIFKYHTTADGLQHLFFICSRRLLGEGSKKGTTTSRD